MDESLIRQTEEISNKRQVVLLFAADDEKYVRETILPLLPAQQWLLRLSTFEADYHYQFEDEQLVICYLNDARLRDVVMQARGAEWTLALLPHPEMKHGRYGYGIASTIEDALNDILENKATQLDLLLCNEQPVFNSVVIGEAFTLTPGEALVEKFRDRVARFWRLLRGTGEVKFTPFKITTNKEKVLDTAALGIVAVEHGRSSALSRRMVADSNANDGMLHALVLAPRSVFEMLRFLFASLFLRNFWNRENPGFIGLIKSSRLLIESPSAIRYTHDEQVEEAERIDLNVERRVLKLMPGRHLSVEDTGSDSKEVVRTQALPIGKAKSELVSHPLPWLHHAATDEFKELFIQVRESAKCTSSYLTLMLLSTLLATFGLFANSTPVVIGAMILAPLMWPIISMALGTLRQDESLMINSGRTIAIGSGLGLACSMVATWFIPLTDINSEIASRISPTLLDMGVAVVSGIAGAYAFARAEVAKTLAGVAIAVALIPPLSVAGIGLGWMDMNVFMGASLLFLTNLVGIVVAALMTFMFLGYSPFHRAKRGLILSLILTVILLIPLAIGFERIVTEHKVMAKLDDVTVSGVRLTDIDVRHRNPMRIRLTLVSADPVTENTFDAVKSEIERRLEREVMLEIAVHVER